MNEGNARVIPLFLVLSLPLFFNPTDPYFAFAYKMFDKNIVGEDCSISYLCSNF
jgi:hypothetical protein